ncbi:MAG: DUF2950 domain-containing protein [Burkholderiales bacterium]
MKQRTAMRNAVVAAATAALLAVAMALPGVASAQKAFATPEAATEALVDSLARHDDAELAVVLGREWRRVMPVGDVSENDRTDFLAAWAKGHRIVRTGDGQAKLELADGWTLPIPLAHGSAGWAFDTAAGADEMRTRRIGRNELAAIQSLYAYVDAQREYATQDRNGDGVLEYAQRILSTPGRRDGLYWSAAAGEPESPAGPLLATEDLKDGYHGYKFRILKGQGPAAHGGARGYVDRAGRMTNGFALVAWPARYGETGVMTFIVNHDGVAYQKNLGPATAAIAGAMARFDPDPTWQALPAP